MWKLTSKFRLSLQILALGIPVLLSPALLLPESAHACMASSIRTPIAQRFEQTPFVFAGTITEVHPEKLTVRVGRYYKGSGPKYISMTGFNKGSCQHTFKQSGGRYIFFAEQEDTKTWKAVYDGKFGAVLPWSDSTVPELRKQGVILP